jgi:hypothetical protein
MKIKLVDICRSKQGDKRGKIVMSFVKCWKNMLLMAQLLQELGGVITVHRFMEYSLSQISNLIYNFFSDSFHFTNSQIKDSHAYVAVASNMSGSTPKELFDDVMEELEKQVIFLKFLIIPSK